MRRPVDARLGDGTAEHALRGVGPAQDYPCPVGTPVRAPFAAKRIIRWGDDNAPGGYALSGYAENGDFWVLQHLSEYRNGRSGDEGEIVALSGDTGTQIWGAHLHHWVSIGGTRYNPEDIGLYDNPQTAGDSSHPFEEDDMFTDQDRALLEDVQRRLRGDKENVDMLQEIREDTDDIQRRVRGDKPALDMLQDALGQIEAARADIAAIAAKIVKPS